MTKLHFVFCGLILLVGCFCIPQRSTLSDDEELDIDDDELDIECFFDDNELSVRGTVISDDAYVWENGEIPYYFNFHKNIRRKRKNKRLIERAMRQIENNACFKFLEMDSEPVEKHHLEIKIGEPSCQGKAFHAGVRKAGPFKVQLESEYQLAGNASCLNWEDGIIHELMHVVGVMHTQKRKDRDQHIIINTENIKDSFKAKYQYQVCEGCNDYGVAYDCSSIMHYGTRTFGASNGQDTMTAKNPSTCQLTKVGSAFDGRGATKTDWQLLKVVSKKVCSGSPPNTTPIPVGPEIPTNKTTPLPVGPEIPTNKTTPRPDKEKPTNSPGYLHCLTYKGPDTGSACVFPFIFNGKTYNKCTFVNSDDGISPWCSTKTDQNDNHIDDGGHYGSCRWPCPIKYDVEYGPGSPFNTTPRPVGPEIPTNKTTLRPEPEKPTNSPGYPGRPNPHCLTYKGPDTGSACVFPFIFDGKTYNKCTFVNSDDGISPWCSTKTDENDNHIDDGSHYGSCRYPCPIKYDVEYGSYPEYDPYGFTNYNTGAGFSGNIGRHGK